MRRTCPLLAATLFCATAALAQEGLPSSAAGLASRLAALPNPVERQVLRAQHSTISDATLLEALIHEALALIGATDYRRAAVAYEMAIELAERLDDPVMLASAQIGLGSVLGRQGDYPAASEGLRAGLGVAEAIGDVERTDAALHNLGIVHRLQGEYEKALDYYGQVVALAERTNRVHVLGPTYNNIGIVHTLRGSYRAALDALHRSVQLKEAEGDRAGLRSTLGNIGDVHLQQGHPELALDYYRRSLDLAERVGHQARTAFTLSDMGVAHARLGDHELALDFYGRALALHDKAGQQADVAATLYNVGRSHEARGDVESARDHYSRSLAIRRAINDRPGIAETLVALGELALRRGETAASLDLANRASRLASETGNRESFWRARVLAGRSDEARGAREPAADAYRDAIETIESLRADVAGGARDRQRYFERRLEPYHRLVALLLASGRPAEALGIAERARARVLFEVLRAGPADRRLLSEQERSRERTLERRLADLWSAAWARTALDSADTAELEQLKAELRQARREHAEFRAALYTAHPTLRLRRGETAAGSVELAGGLLEDEHTALLEFLVAEDATYLFVLSHGQHDQLPGARVAAFRIPLARERLAAIVARFRGRLADRDLDFQQTAREAYDAVLGVADAWLSDKTTLIIVPDGPLWELPFQALRGPQGHYLIEQAAISYAPSIGVLHELRARRTGGPDVAEPALLALADPVPAGAAAGPRTSTPAFAPLPDAVRQVRALSRAYGAHRSRILLGRAATERALRDASRQATVLHLATHGVVDNASPMYSFLLLSGDPAGDAAADGRLEAWEVADLSLPVEAVVVAACETALGRVGPGEGMIGLSWAFFLAGSPRTLASLWKVDAASTTELMLAFHGRFREGLTRDARRPGAAASLRQGALSLLRSSRYRHPFYWAGFVLIGDGR